MGGLLTINFFNGQCSKVRQAMKTRRMRILKRPPGIIVHHSAGRRNATVEAVRRYCMDVRKMQDIAYHICIRQCGSEWQREQGRSLKYYGEHCKGKQNYIGVAVFGNYEETTLPEDARSCLVATLADLCSEYGFHPFFNIFRHKDFKASTDCPGDDIISQWGSIINAVTGRIPFGGQA